MPKYKSELILLIILIPILVYIGWQAYNTYFKPPAIEIEELEKAGIEEPTEPITELAIKKPAPTAEPKGVLDYTGYIKRDPLKPSLPVKEKPPEPLLEKKGEGILPEQKKKEPPKEIVLPTFIVTGIVWGKASPRTIIDHKVYKIGDIVKGAKILDITEKGIHMIYEEKEFWINVQRGG